MSDKPLFFFDIGGSQFGAQSEPCCEGLDSNIFLSRILDNFKEFLRDRITIENLISRMGTRLFDSGFFIPLRYKLIYPDNEQEILVGSYKQRYTQANESDTAFGLQLRTSFENSDTITVYTVNNGVDRDKARDLAEELAEIINFLIDSDNSGKHIDEITVAEYSMYDDDIENRDLARGLKEACFPVIGVCFGVSPTGKLYRFLQSTAGMDVTIHIFSLFLDTAIEEMP